MEDKDILQEIPDEQLPILRDLYKNHWPTAIHAYYYLDNYIEWKKRSETSTPRFLCPEGRWDDGTFIAVESHFMYTVFVFTLEKSCERLYAALSKTKEINWSEPNLHILFVTVHADHHPTVCKVLNEKKISILHEDVSNLWWISKEEAKKYTYELPEGVYASPLKEEDVKVINPIWPHRGAASELYLTQLIRLNGGFGIYHKENNELCSWIMRNNYGGLAILQTLDEHKRKGYGAFLTKYFSKFWAEKGLDIFCFIMTANTASQILFQNLGYKKEHGVTWIQTKSN